LLLLEGKPVPDLPAAEGDLAGPVTDVKDRGWVFGLDFTSNAECAATRGRNRATSFVTKKWSVSTPNAKANVNSRRRRGEGENAANRATKLKGRLGRHNNVNTNTLRFHELQIIGLATGRPVKGWQRTPARVVVVGRDISVGSRPIASSVSELLVAFMLPNS
jgi:hypothetical protein